MRQKKAELANLVVTIGEKGLLDFFSEKFWPAVKDARVEGRGEVHAYLLYSLKLEMVGGDSVGLPCLYGRIIRLMTIQAEQRFDAAKSEIVPSKETLESAPSSFFVISLPDHKISFLPESRNRAPSLRDLEYCFKQVLRTQWRKDRDNARREMLNSVGRKRIPKGSSDVWHEEIERKFPEPEVRISPLPAIDDLKKRLSFYELLSAVELRPLKTNNELPDENADFLKQYAATAKRLKTRKDKIEFSNTRDGLEKDQAEKLISHASDGNYQVKLKGKDKEGRPIQDDLENMRVQIFYLMEKGETDSMKALKLLSLLKETLNKGAIATKDVIESNVEKARQELKKLLGGL